MNGIYLFLLLREIHDKIADLYIDEITMMKRLIQIVCGQESLFISLFPEAPGIFFSKKTKSGFEILKKFSDEVQSSRIIKIEQLHFMPVVRLQLTKSSFGELQRSEIIVSLYREAPNFSIKSERTQKNLFPRYIEKTPKPSILELAESHLESLSTQKGKTSSAENLVKEIEGIDKYLARELTHANFKKLRAILTGVNVQPRLVSTSPLRISFFASHYIKEYPSFNSLFAEGIRNFIEEKSIVWAQSRKHALIKNVRVRIDRLKKKLMSDEEIEHYRITGELILTNIYKIKKREKEVQVFNPYTQKECTIKLDPLKTPQENAQAHFSKYKKLKRGQPKLKQKIETLKKEIENIEASSLKMPETVSSQVRARKERPQPFRSFNLASGSVVYVGKNARSNEELTFKLARPNDYFFHIRGYRGPHTILKARVPRGQKPKKEDIESAASIAAYFSKLKHQKNIPVSYTQRKYLKKNKKGKPGSVILMREKVVFVDPKLPQKSSQ